MSETDDLLNRLPSFIRKHITGENCEHLLNVLLLVGGLATLASAIVIAAIFKQGHTTIFSPNEPHVSWVKGPDTRGTFNIIWICATTIFTCVYVTVHVDVPDRGDDNDIPELTRGGRSRIQWWTLLFHSWISNAPKRLWRTIKPSLRKAYWVFFNIFAPELMVFVAFCERESAKSGVTFMRDKCAGQKKWKLRHAFFADMGGFKLPKDEGGQPGQAKAKEFHSGHSFYEWYLNVHRECPTSTLDLREIERDANDRSKKDVVLKIFTCFQAAWFIVETLERFAQNQPVSPLEVTTCSYIVCAIITELLWLRKPYGVNRNHSVHMIKTSPSSALPKGSPDVEKQCESTLASAPEDMGISLKDQLPRLLFKHASYTPFNRAFMKPRESMLISCLWACSVGVIVGFIHIIPFWNTSFINTEGQWMWRACCCVQISIFIAFAVGAAIEPLYHGVLLWISFLFLCLFYCMSRIVLFALVWTSFSAQPIALYQNVHWGFGLFPHWD